MTPELLPAEPREPEWDPDCPVGLFDAVTVVAPAMAPVAAPVAHAMEMQAAYGNAAVARAAESGAFAPAASPSTMPGYAPERAQATAPTARAPAVEPANETIEEEAASEPPAVAVESSSTGASAGETAKAPSPTGEEPASDDADAALASALAAPPSQAIASLAAARRAGGEGINEERAALAADPPALDSPTGLPRKEAEERAESEATARVATPGTVEAPAGAVDFEVTHVASQAELPAARIAPSVVEGLPDGSEQLAGAASDAVRAMPTDDASVDTSAGAPPPLRLDADASPAQVGEQEASVRDATSEALRAAASEMGEEQGENEIYPVTPKVTLRAAVAPGAMPAKESLLAEPDAPPEALASFDQAAAANWSAEVGKASQSHEAAKQEKSDNERDRRAAADTEISRLEGEAAAEQGQAQDTAREEVGAARATWKRDLDGAQDAYGAKSSSLRARYQGDIEKTRGEANAQARAKLEAAEAEALAKKREAREKAEAKKAEGEKESEGFFSWVRSGIKSFIQGLKDAVNAIFDVLRAAVKFIIEQAKKAALWVVDQARKAIVLMLRTWGALLFLAADVFLAAFPEARKKAKALIRGAVQLAERAVNAIADALKTAVSAVLDAFGAALDFVLAVYQKAYNLVLDVLEFALIGWVDLLEGIARLAQSAFMVGDFFIGQVEEEGLGVDLTQPLPIEKRETAAAPETALKTEAKAAVEAGTLSPSDAGLFERQRLADSDAEADHVAELDLDPALLRSLPPMKDGDEHHFGENDAPENRREAILGDALAAQSAPVMTVPPAQDEEAASQAAPRGEASSVAGKTPEEQLDELERQETPHTCDTKKTEEPAGKDEVPEEMRIYGPFTSGQRFRYMWGQIKKGISQWWSCNWGKVVAALAVGALVAILLGILTSGAIFAAIPPLLTIIAALMTVYALVRAAAYVKDFVVLAWGKDLKGGAKALARAFAILVIELVFTLLFNLKAVLKALKGGIKGTIKAAVGAAKTAMKATARAGRRLGRVLAVSAKRSVRNAKLIIAGFRSGFGKGIKSVEQLAAKMLRKTRFRGFYFRLRGLTLELWGRFNADVLLGKQKITLEQARQWFEEIAGAARKLSPEARKEAQLIAEEVGIAVLAGSKLGEKLRARVATFFQAFKHQSVAHNPILAEVWERSLKKLAESGSFAKWFDEAGNLKPNVPPEKMMAMYKEARQHANKQLQIVVKKLEDDFAQKLGKEIVNLGENVQVHHMVYKAWKPEFALLKENLVLALRKTGGSADELHDLMHLVTAGGQGNRWRTLQAEVGDIIREVYKF